MYATVLVSFGKHNLISRLIISYAKQLYICERGETITTAKLQQLNSFKWNTFITKFICVCVLALTFIIEDPVGKLGPRICFEKKLKSFRILEWQSFKSGIFDDDDIQINGIYRLYQGYYCAENWSLNKFCVNKKKFPR